MQFVINLSRNIGSFGICGTCRSFDPSNNKCKKTGKAKEKYLMCTVDGGFGYYPIDDYGDSLVFVDSKEKINIDNCTAKRVNIIIEFIDVNNCSDFIVITGVVKKIVNILCWNNYHSYFDCKLNFEKKDNNCFLSFSLEKVVIDHIINTLVHISTYSTDVIIKLFISMLLKKIFKQSKTNSKVNKTLTKKVEALLKALKKLLPRIKIKMKFDCEIK